MSFWIKFLDIPDSYVYNINDLDLENKLELKNLIKREKLIYWNRVAVMTEEYVESIASIENIYSYFMEQPKFLNDAQNKLLFDNYVIKINDDIPGILRMRNEKDSLKKHNILFSIKGGKLRGFFDIYKEIS